jgi:hypothetical protein
MSQNGKKCHYLTCNDDAIVECDLAGEDVIICIDSWSLICLNIF